MTRNLKALGLALVAVFAMSAMAASGAQATDATFSWDEDTKFLTAHEESSQVFSTTAGSFTCDMVTGHANVEGINDVKTVTGTEVIYWNTASGSKEEAKCEGPFGTSPTIETNGCHFRFNAGETTAAGTSEGTVDIIGCTGGEITINAPLCTIHVTEQEGVGPVTYHTVSGSPEDVTIESHANNIVSHHEGFFCGGSAHTDTAGTYTGKVTITGYRDAAHTEQTNVTIT